MIYLNYLWYVIRHKWWVLVASFKVGSSIWLAIVHDLSKFRPSEFFPYARYLFDKRKVKPPHFMTDFEVAWNHHQKRNKHHWQYWVLERNSTNVKTIEMPKRFAKEMVADWMGAGRAITGKWDIKEWYEKQNEYMTLHPETRKYVESLIEKLA